MSITFFAPFTVTRLIPILRNAGVRSETHSCFVAVSRAIM